MADVSIVPPFIVFQRPVFQFSTAGDNDNSRSNSSRNVARVFFDEVASDVVVFSAASCEVCFYHMQLREDSNQADSIVSSPLQHNEGVSSADETNTLQEDEEWLRHHPSLPSDAIALRVKCPYGDGRDALTIRHAKRCPVALHNGNGDGRRGRDTRAYLVALSFDTEQVFFFRCHHQLEVQPLAAVATFQCAPRNLRFRESFYPIHAFYWTDKLQGAKQTTWPQGSLETPQTEDERQQREDPKRGKGVELESLASSHLTQRASTTTSTLRILLCVTSISIDLVGVDESMLLPLPPPRAARTGSCDGDNVVAAGGRLCILLRRYPTHTDYWHYSPVAQTFLSVNKRKPCFVKTFTIRDETLRTMSTLRLEEDLAAPGDNDMESSMFYSSACMDVPAVQYPIGFLVVYRNLFICAASRRDGCIVLFRYTLSADGKNDLGFVKYLVLRPDFSIDAWHEPIMLQVVDNLILLHVLHKELTTVFDIILNEKRENIFIPEALTESLASAPSSSAKSAVFGTQCSTGFTAPSYGGVFLDESTTVKSGKCPSVSWIARFASNLLHGDNDYCNSTTGNGGDSGSGSQTHTQNKGDVTVLIVRPLLNASLSFYPPLMREAPVGFGCNVHYSRDFIFGKLPLLLDRQNGTVCLIGVNPFAIAAILPKGSQRMQFFLHRMYCAGNVVPSIVHAMLAAQENLAVVAEAFEMITAHHAVQQHQLLQSEAKREGIPSWTRETPCFGAAASEPHRRTDVFLSGPPSALRRWLPKEDAEGPLPSCPPWRRWSGLTPREVLSTCMTPHTVECESCVGHSIDARIGQVAMQRDVFSPLADVVFRVGDMDEVANATATSKVAVGEATPEFDPSETCGMSAGQKCFLQYLFYALLEYAWCVLQRGFILNFSLQHLLLRLYYASSPACELLHQLLFPGIITDEVPTAMLLLRMGGKNRQLGFDMLLRLQANALIVQEFLKAREPLEAAKYFCSGEHKWTTQLDQQRSSMKTMGDILQCALEVLFDEERGVEVHKTRRSALEFVTVYEMITDFLLRHPLTEGVLPPPQLFPVAVKYYKLLSDGGLGQDV